MTNESEKAPREMSDEELRDESTWDFENAEQLPPPARKARAIVSVAFPGADFDYVSETGRARDTRLESKDMPDFMAGLNSCSESMRLLFLSSLYTGRRMGEVQAMRWKELDLETGVWKILQTKTGKKQEAMMPTALTEQLNVRERKINSPWVFPSPSKSGHVEEIIKAWKLVRKVSGLHDLQARDLRRTLASWAQDVNVPIAAVQAQLGHASISTTAKHYTAISRDVKRAALETTVTSMIEAAAK